MDPKDEVVEPVEENLELPEVEEGEEDTTDYKAEALKLRDKAIAQRERTKALKKELADTKKAVEIAAGLTKDPASVKKDELSDAVLDFFELKGYDEDQVDVFHKIMQKTGMSHREVIKDEYAIAKVKAIKDEKDVRAAIPGNTKRAGGQVGDVTAAAAKFKDSGVLPEDQELADAVVDSIAKAGNDRLPPWQRH